MKKENEIISCKLCKHMIFKKELRYGLWMDIPYCSLGVTNSKNDKNRKNGMCQLFEREFPRNSKDLFNNIKRAQKKDRKF